MAGSRTNKRLDPPRVRKGGVPRKLLRAIRSLFGSGLAMLRPRPIRLECRSLVCYTYGPGLPWHNRPPLRQLESHLRFGGEAHRPHEPIRALCDADLTWRRHRSWRFWWPVDPTRCSDVVFSDPFLAYGSPLLCSATDFR